MCRCRDAMGAGAGRGRACGVVALRLARWRGDGASLRPRATHAGSRDHTLGVGAGGDAHAPCGAGVVTGDAGSGGRGGRATAGLYLAARVLGGRFGDVHRRGHDARGRRRWSGQAGTRIARSDRRRPGRDRPPIDGRIRPAVRRPCAIRRRDDRSGDRQFDGPRRHARAGSTALASPSPRRRYGRDSTRSLAGDGNNRTPEILGPSPAIAALRNSQSRRAIVRRADRGQAAQVRTGRSRHPSAERAAHCRCAVSCAALTDELVSGAVRVRPRRIHRRGGAHERGSSKRRTAALFLDEVGGFAARTGRLLRALQAQVRRLGENAPRAVDVRVVAATNLP